MKRFIIETIDQEFEFEADCITYDKELLEVIVNHNVIAAFTAWELWLDKGEIEPSAKKDLAVNEVKNNLA